jgi:hypothetical protein
MMASEFPPVLMERLSAIPGATSMEVKNVTTWGAGQSSKLLVAVLWFRGPPEDTGKAAEDVAAAMLQHHPDVASAQTLAVTIIRGWDVGVFSMTSGQNYVRTPAEWRAELGL